MNETLCYVGQSTAGKGCPEHLGQDKRCSTRTGSKSKAGHNEEIEAGQAKSSFFITSGTLLARQTGQTVSTMSNRDLHSYTTIKNTEVDNTWCLAGHLHFTARLLDRSMQDSIPGACIPDAYQDQQASPANFSFIPAVRLSTCLSTT